MRKLTILNIILIPSLIFAQSMPSSLGSLDSDYLDSLPESVRKDLEQEIARNEKDQNDNLKKRPSSELLKYELVSEWEEFKRKKDEKLNKSERYGLNLFRTMQSSFMPINEPNFGNNYILDYGDVIGINLYGNISSKYEIEIERDGTIMLPDIGSLMISGLNYQEGVEKITQAIENSYTGVKAVINLKEIRDIKILITGNVEFPGIYTLSGNSNVLQALNIAGGVSESGTLREIEIKRDGKIVSVIDLYDSLIFGDISGLKQLHSGDSIYVKQAKKLIRAASGFINEAIFEIKDDENLIDFFKYSGGVDRSITNLNFTIIGIEGNVENSFSVESNNLADYKLKHLDAIYFKKLNLGTIKISGQVQRPGTYSIKPGDDIFDIITRAGGYSNIAYPFGSVLKREEVVNLEKEYINKSYQNIISFIAQNPDKLQANTGIGMILEQFKNMQPTGRVITEFDFEVLNDEPSKRILLEDGDEIYIPTMNNSVYVYGDVGNPQALNFSDLLPIKDYIQKAGGMKRTADKSHIMIINPNGEASLVNLSTLPNLIRQDVDIYPGSLIYVPQKLGTVQGVEFYSVIAPIFSSLALSLASLNAIND